MSVYLQPVKVKPGFEPINYIEARLVELQREYTDVQNAIYSLEDKICSQRVEDLEREISERRLSSLKRQLYALKKERNRLLEKARLQEQAKQEELKQIQHKREMEQQAVRIEAKICQKQKNAELEIKKQESAAEIKKAKKELIESQQRLEQKKARIRKQFNKYRSELENTLKSLASSSLYAARARSAEKAKIALAEFNDFCEAVLQIVGEVKDDANAGTERGEE